jgi:NAD(P)-dependent dehydrogenase (short-subunit alcohol dehydrogenase family)
MSRHLDGKVVVVTGGAGADAGLGLTTTECLAREGARVVVWDKNPEANDHARTELAGQGLEVLFQEVDVTDLAQLRDSYDDLRNTLGPVDVVVNNAALKMDFMLGLKSSRSHDTVPFWEFNVQRFRELIEVNLTGAFQVAYVIVPDMVRRSKGSIINVVTSPHTQSSPNHIPYGPSKAALQAMTLAMAEQLRNHGVWVNAVAPGRAVNRRGEYDPLRAPYDCMVTPLLWLASDDSSEVTGKVFSGTEFEVP